MSLSPGKVSGSGWHWKKSRLSRRWQQRERTAIALGQRLEMGDKQMGGIQGEGDLV